MKRRRELAGVSGGGGLLPKLIILVVILAILGYVGYLGWVARGGGQRFAAERAANPHVLTLAGTTEFLPNTLLAGLDPAFYNQSTMSGAALTRRLMKLYYPDTSGIELRVISVSVEAQYPKTDIMESFINAVPMGGGAHPVKGLAAASNFYFGKPFAQLAPQDIALLVALIKDPAGLDPRESPEKAFDARNLVLQADLQQNVLSQAQVDNLTKMPLDVVPLATPTQAPAPATK
ncbi:MAG TPA: transglycosylase domain-containing protein [Gammaproteobacteria bacterium]